MRLKTISCPLCRSSNFVEVYRRKLDWLNYEYVNVVCKECGFIYRNPSMDYDDYLEFYENGGLLSSNQFINYDESSRSNIVRDLRTKFIFENLSIKSGKIMDIGGGNGFLLENFNPDSWE